MVKFYDGEDSILLLEEAIHLSQTPPSLGTRGSLIIDLYIASYSNPLTSSILFLYFILQLKLWLDTIQGAPHPYQTASNVGNGNPLRSASSRSRKGCYGKISAVDPTEANTGFFYPSFFVLLFPTRMPLNFS